MGFPFAHGTKKRWIVAALWQLSPSQFGDNSRQVSFAKHVRPFQRLSWLHGILKNRSCQGLSPIPVVTEDIPKTANITPFGLFEYLLTPFGLSNAAQTFQRMMDRTTDGLEGAFTYMDDSQVGSPDRQTHLYHLEAFFTALATKGLAINLEKCVFAAPSLEILGHTILATGEAPMADYTAKIENCPPPQDIKQLQHFLGIVNFNRRFLPNCAQVLRPLTDLLKGVAKTLEWTASA
jgi:hypothetical protein